MKKNKLIPSPLRYPGGKSKILKKFKDYFPKEFNEFWEPMAGGSSVLLNIFQTNNKLKKVILNDVNPFVYSFWKSTKLNKEKIIDEILKFYGLEEKSNIELSLKKCKEYKGEDVFIKGACFFFINRVTFSGVESGGLSMEAYNKRFTFSSIKRLDAVSSILKNKKLEVFNEDYETILNTKSNNKVFIYLDPPYFSNGNSKLYGKNGDLHDKFDHIRLAKILKNIKHNFMLSYDDDHKIRELYSWANIKEIEISNYPMNFNKKSKKELIITNY